MLETYLIADRWELMSLLYELPHSVHVTCNGLQFLSKDGLRFVGMPLGVRPAGLALIPVNPFAVRGPPMR
ncbi:hypothetical protein ACWENQ_34960 [Nonomuraea sp. NPDC004354]